MLNAVPPAPEGATSSNRAGGGARGNRRNGRRGQVAGATPRPVTMFEGTDPAMKGFIYDVPNGLNHEQFTKTTKQLAIAMASDMGMYATELSGAFDTLNLVMPAPVPGPGDPANVVAVHLWKRDLKMFDDAVQAQNTFKTKVFLKVEGQCTETMKSSVARHARSSKRGGYRNVDIT